MRNMIFQMTEFLATMRETSVIIYTSHLETGGSVVEAPKIARLEPYRPFCVGLLQKDSVCYKKINGKN